MHTCVSDNMLFQDWIQAVRTAMVADHRSQVTDLACFFWDHLRKDLRIIGKSLSCSENEVLMVLHKIIHHLAGMQPTIGKCIAVAS